MLIVKVYVNNREIDEIRIQNTLKKTVAGEAIYEIRKPEMKNSKVLHKRENGYRVLLMKALTLIEQQMTDSEVLKWMSNLMLI